MNTKGVSHVEIIISIVVFVGFLLVLFLMINPLEVSRKNVDYSESVMNELIENVRANISKVSVKVGTGNNEFEIQLKEQGNLILKDRDEDFFNLADFGRSTVDVNKICIDNSGASGNFYTILISPHFTKREKVCSKGASIDYTLGVIQEINAIFYNKIVNFNNTYWNSYETAKDKVGLSQKDDFGFIIYDSGGKEVVNALKGQIKRLNLNVKEESIKILYENGEFKQMNLKIFVY